MKKTSDQSGMASFLFTLVMMLVITLIVLSFGQLVRHGQKEALDSQLSTEAYYAADSGINDAAQAINYLASRNAVVEKPTCAPVGSYTDYFASVNRTNKLADNVSYTCLKVSTILDDLKADLSTSSSTVLNIQPSSPTSSIEVNWKSLLGEGEEDESIGQCPENNTAVGVFHPVFFWDLLCSHGVLRFDLVPTSGTFTADQLAQRTMTVFAVPTRNGTATTAKVTYNGVTPPQGVRANAVCSQIGDSANRCRLTIDGLAGYSQYSMRAIMIYKNASLTVFSATPGVKLINSQAMVDVTGKAQDVLRRVQVRLPLEGSKGAPDYAVSSQTSVCKRFSVGPALFRQGDTSCLAD